MTIIREERIGNQRLILGDCLEVMPTLGRFDAVVTDPPYGIDPDGVGYGRTGRAIANDFNEEIMKAGINMALGLMECGMAAMFYSARITPRVFAGPMAGLYAGEIIWDKKAPGMGGALRYQHENIALFSVGGASVACPVFSVLQYYRAAQMHPHEKPVGLIERLLEVVGGQTILDPFMGSGTTLVACQKLGRQGVGIELDPDWFEIACRRVEEAARQPDLLIPETRAAPMQEKLL